MKRFVLASLVVVGWAGMAAAHVVPADMGPHPMCPDGCALVIKAGNPMLPVYPYRARTAAKENKS